MLIHNEIPNKNGREKQRHENKGNPLTSLLYKYNDRIIGRGKMGPKEIGLLHAKY